jgi:integrase
MKTRHNPKYVKHWWTGTKWCNQYRRDGKLIRLPDGHFTEAFWKAYWAAEAEILSDSAPAPAGGRKVKSGSIEAGLAAFYKSTSFLGLADTTRRNFRSQLEGVREAIGDEPLKRLRPKIVMALLDGEPTGSAKMLLTALRSFVRYALQAELLDTDPTTGVRPPKRETTSHHTWEEAEVEQFCCRHPAGTTAHLALMLHLCTAQRLSDIIRMGRQHIRGDAIWVKQQKTGVELTIPIHADLKPLLDALPRTALTFLTSPHKGTPLGKGYYDHLFRAWVREAGLRAHCTSHGLRRLAMKRLAECGCTAPEIMAISGHKTLSEVQHYIDAVNQEKLARRAMASVSMLRTGTQNV